MPVVHAVGLAVGVGAAAGISTIVVHTPKELVDALKQREKAIVIDNPEMARRFNLALALGAIVLIGHLLASTVNNAILRGYGVEMSGSYDWKVKKLDGKIVLTPPEK